MGTVLLVIFSLNLILSLCMIKAYFNQPERRYYSTDGVKPPEQLVAMDDANMTSNAMLADDPINEDVVKTVPE
jgi:intracellular multiplication protein IcmM